MPECRFYIPEDLKKGQELTLSGEEFEHLKVMRLRAEDDLELINGKGALAQAKILHVHKKEAALKIHDLHIEPAPSFQLILAQALPRQNRLDIILEKGTELGMTEILLFPGALSEKKEMSSQALARAHKILIAAIKQCGALFLPKLSLSPPLEKWKGLPYPAFFGDVNPAAPPLFSAWKNALPCDGALFFVGPEKGFTSKEEGIFKLLGATGVSLSRNILRTDTAPLAALALMSHFLLTSAGKNT